MPKDAHKKDGRNSGSRSRVQPYSKSSGFRHNLESRKHVSQQRQQQSQQYQQQQWQQQQQQLAGITNKNKQQQRLKAAASSLLSQVSANALSALLDEAASELADKGIRTATAQPQVAAAAAGGCSFAEAA